MCEHNRHRTLEHSLQVYVRARGNKGGGCDRVSEPKEIESWRVVCPRTRGLIMLSINSLK